MTGAHDSQPVQSAELSAEEHHLHGKVRAVVECGHLHHTFVRRGTAARELLEQHISVQEIGRGKARECRRGLVEVVPA